MAVNLSPLGNDAPFVDVNGDPLTGGLLYTYVAGSSTPATTYQSNVASPTANANPIVLNSNGYPSSGGSVVSIWLTSGVTYKFVLKTSTGTTVWSRDSIAGINDVSLGALDQWIAGSAPTYVSATSFTLSTDLTSTYQAGRRVKTTNSGGTIYSTVKTATYSGGTGLSTVTIVNDSGTLDSGLSAVYYGILSATNPSTPLLTDAYPIVSGSSDKTKKFRLEADGFTTDTTRVGTLPDCDITLGFPKGYIFGGTMSNGTDATNDINVTAGQAKDSTGAIDITWSALAGKQLDAAWAVGANAGMRDTGAIANGTWHIYAIRKNSDGSGDILASLSASAPTMPSGYTYFRRIGSILREGAALVAFTQDGDYFRRSASVLDINSNNPGTSAVTATLSVPTGVNVLAIINAGAVLSGDTSSAMVVSDLAANDEAPSNSAAPLYSQGLSQNSAAAGLAISSVVRIVERTNTSAQVRYRLTASSASVTARIATLGWYDRRGRDA